MRFFQSVRVARDWGVQDCCWVPCIVHVFSRHLVPAFKSRDLFESACNGERRQTLYSCVYDSLEVMRNHLEK